MARRGFRSIPVVRRIGTGWWREERRGELTWSELVVEGEAERLAAARNTRSRQPASQVGGRVSTASLSATQPACQSYPLSFQPVQPASQPVSPVSPSIPSVVLSASATSLSVILVGYPFSQYNWSVRQAVSPSVPCAVLSGSRVCPSAESQDPQPQPVSLSLPQR